MCPPYVEFFKSKIVFDKGWIDMNEQILITSISISLCQNHVKLLPIHFRFLEGEGIKSADMLVGILTEER